MRLAFPLKAGVDLSAALEPGGAKRVTLRYGKRSRVRRSPARGLRESDSRTRRSSSSEFFGEGALIRERITHSSNRRSRDAGIRDCPPVHPGGSPPTTPGRSATSRAQTLGGRLAVRTERRFERRSAGCSRVDASCSAGRLVALAPGSPAGGKLLELQVQARTATRYQTVGQGFRSKPNGSYRIGYRFGRFYQYDVRFRFRIKVAREADWPYKAPVRSRTRPSPCSTADLRSTRSA